MIDQSGNKNFFQIYITENDTLELPPLISNCVNHVKFWATDHAHFVFSGANIRDAISLNLSSDVLRAYDCLRPYAYKADLGRLCLLYLYGGWYMDITCKLARQLPDVQSFSHVIFCPPFGIGHSSWDLQNSMIYARRGSKVLDLAIQRIVGNCSDKYYGVNALCPTGPTLLGSAFATHGMDAEIMVCQYMPLTPNYQKKNYGFILNNGDIIAWGKETGGTNMGNGLFAYGAEGTNSYAALYNSGEIYI